MSTPSNKKIVGPGTVVAITYSRMKKHNHHKARLNAIINASEGALPRPVCLRHAQADHQKQLTPHCARSSIKYSAILIMTDAHQESRHFYAGFFGE